MPLVDDPPAAPRTTPTRTAPWTWLGPPRDGNVPPPPSTDAASPRVWTADEFFARYRILDLLGEGGMGRVMRAHDHLLGRDVALKLPWGRPSPEFQARALAEARLGARLDHPGVVRVFDAGIEPDGQFFFTMEILHGETLAETSTQLSPTRRLEVLLRVCEVVASAHRAGIVHRDLKPANILLNENGDVRVLDWGIAADLGKPAPAAGTPAYARPEQMSGQPAAIADDLYALGVVLADLGPDTAAAHAVSRWAREARYRDVLAFAADVHALLLGDPVLALPDSLPAQAGRHVRKNLSSYALGVAVALGALAVGLAVATAEAVRQAQSSELNARESQVQANLAKDERLLAEAERALADRDRLRLEGLLKKLERPDDPRAVGLRIAASALLKPALVDHHESTCFQILQFDTDVLCGREAWSRWVAAKKLVEPVPIAPTTLPWYALAGPPGRADLDLAWSRGGRVVPLGGGEAWNHPFPPDAPMSAVGARTADGRAWIGVPGGLAWTDFGQGSGFVFLGGEVAWVLALSDGDLLVSTQDKVLRLDPRGQTVWIAPHRGDDASIGPDGRLFVAGGSSGSDGRLRVVDPETGSLVGLFEPLDGSIKHVHTAGGRVAVCTSGGTVAVSEPGATGAWAASWMAYSDGRTCAGVHLDPTATHLAVSRLGPGLAIWALDDGPPRAWVAPGPVLDVTWQGEDLLFSVRSLGVYRADTRPVPDLVDPRSGGEPLAIDAGGSLWRGFGDGTISGPFGTSRLLHHPYGLVPLPDGSMFAYGMSGLATRIRADGTTAWSYGSFQANSMMRAAHHDGKIAVLEGGELLRVFDAATGTLLADTREGGPWFGVGFSPDGGSLYAGTRQIPESGAPRDPLRPNARLLRFDFLSRSKLHLIVQADMPATASSITTTPDGRVVVADLSGRVSIFAPDLTELARFRAHQTDIHRSALHPDGRRLATASADGSVRVWDLDPTAP
jgi:WD40 repeat protein